MKQENKKNWFVKNKITTIMLGSLFFFLYFVYLLTTSFTKMAELEVTDAQIFAKEISQHMPFLQTSKVLLITAIIMKVIKACNNRAKTKAQEVTE